MKDTTQDLRQTLSDWAKINVNFFSVVKKEKHK